MSSLFLGVAFHGQAACQLQRPSALLPFFALSSLSFNISNFDKIRLSFIGIVDFLGQNYDCDPYDPYDQISLNHLKDSFPVSRFECLGLSTTGKQAP